MLEGHDPKKLTTNPFEQTFAERWTPDADSWRGIFSAFLILVLALRGA